MSPRRLSPVTISRRLCLPIPRRMDSTCMGGSNLHQAGYVWNLWPFMDLSSLLLFGWMDHGCCRWVVDSGFLCSLVELTTMLQRHSKDVTNIFYPSHNQFYTILPLCQNAVHIIFLKSSDAKFDQVYSRKFEHLQYQINTIRFIMTYIFVWYIFDIIGINNFSNKLGQRWWCMTFQKTYMHYIMARRGYVSSI
jgi:hypothetical protein